MPRDRKPQTDTNKAVTALNKSTALNVGSIALIAAVVVAVVVFLGWEDSRIEKIVTTTVKTTMERHAIQPIDAAHPDAARQYVSKRELNGSLNKIQRRVDRIEQDNIAQHRTILMRLPARPLRNHAPLPRGNP